MENKIPSFLQERPSSVCPEGGKTVKMPFLEKGLYRVTSVLRAGYNMAESASEEHFFQRLDPRVKLVFLLFYALIVSLKKTVLPELAILIFLFLLVVAARLRVIAFFRRVFLLTFFFGFVVAFPSSLNVITAGEVILPVLHLSGPYDFLGHEIPAEIGITREGLYGVAMLSLRVMNSVSISLFVLSTTPFPLIIKALKYIRVPDAVLMIVTLSYKYIFILLKTVEDMHLAKKSRVAGQVAGLDARRWAAGRIALVFRKTQQRCEDIFKAMLGRGFSGEEKVCMTQRLQIKDWIAAAGFFFFGAAFLWM